MFQYGVHKTVAGNDHISDLPIAYTQFYEIIGSTHNENMDASMYAVSFYPKSLSSYSYGVWQQTIDIIWLAFGI